MEKLVQRGVDKQTVRWIENWLNGQDQRTVISGMRSRWRPVISGALQGAILGTILSLQISAVLL